MSKAEVSVKELSVSLKFLKRFVGRDGAPLARFGEDGMVSAHGGASGARCSAPGGLGAFAAPLDRLLAITATAESQRVEEVEIGVTDSNLTWRAGAAQGRVALIGDASVEFPRPAGESVAVGDAFYAALDQAVAVCPRGDKWPLLRGVCWSRGGLLMASDGGRAIVCHTGRAGLDVTIPDHVVQGVVGYAFSRAAAGERSVHFSSEDGSEAYGVLYASEFPYARFAEIFGVFGRRVAAGELTRFAVDYETQPAVALVKRVADAAEAPLHPVRVRVDPDGVEAWCESEAGEVRVRLTAVVEGAPTEFTVNGEYLAEVVGYCCPVWVSENALYAASPSGSFQAAVMLFRE